MKSLIQYINESQNPITDEAILYKIGKYKFNANQTIRSNGSNSLQNAIKKYNIDKNNPRPGLIRWAKDVTPKLLPDDEEIIHRKDWSLDTLNGETEKQLLHLDYWTINQYILQKHKRKHDILTIFECSTSKPYASNKIIKHNYTDKYGVFSDFACMSNPGVIPLEFSQFYPYRFDEWDHGAENDDISNKYCIVNKYRFINYVKKLGYKHVIVIMQNPHTQLCFDAAYKENLNNCNKWLHIVTDDQFRKKLGDKYLPKFNNNWGLVIQRTLIMPMVKKRYEKLLKSCLNDKDKLKFEELQKYIKLKDNQKIESWNKEHGFEPINYVKGIKNANFKRLTPKDVFETEKVNKYKAFIEKEIEKIISDTKNVDGKYYEVNIYKTVLDWILLYFKDNHIDDPDTEYWNMKKALDEVNGLTCFCEYCYFINELCKKYNIKEKELKKEADKLKLVQLKLKQQQVNFAKIK